jgi:GTPase
MESTASPQHEHIARTAISLRALLDDRGIPPSVRAALAQDFAEIESILTKLERGEVHIAVFGRVSVGKSALLNALAGKAHFEVGVLHGTTQRSAQMTWREIADGPVHLIDTPGINELDGEGREKMAVAVAARADLILFVCDGDLTDTEFTALVQIASLQRPVLLVLNKSDRYNSDDLATLLDHLRTRVVALIPPQHVISASAAPRARTVIRIDQAGQETLSQEPQAVAVEQIREAIETILLREGKTLAALSAGLFAGDVSERLAEKIVQARAQVADKLIRGYCLAKGVAVGLNPVPITDLVAAAGLDLSLIVHLSHVYQMPMTRVEASSLIGTLVKQLTLLMGGIWGMHLLSSAMKSVSGGLSTALTAGAEGAMAWYATLVTGRAAQRYLQNGKSWGTLGPKRVLEEVLDSLDRDSVLRDAKAEILAKLRA